MSYVNLISQRVSLILILHMRYSTEIIILITIIKQLAILRGFPMRALGCFKRY